jgi:DNA-binding beta-propeller fold protein YncE
MVSGICAACAGGSAAVEDVAQQRQGDSLAAPIVTSLPTSLVAVPGGATGIGFDELTYSTRLHRLLVPAGGTGTMSLVDPSSSGLEVIAGFGTAPFTGGHDDGVTSAVDAPFRRVLTTDRTALTLSLVDPDPRHAAIVASVPLGSSPDYVRYVRATGEAWVSEPDEHRIEIFAGADRKSPTLRSIGTVSVPGGPEALALDPRRGRAYTNQSSGDTFAIDLESRRVVAQWKNGCSLPRGLEVDEDRGFVFLACKEGKLAVLDAAHGGAVLASLAVAGPVDQVAYNPKLRHLYTASAAKTLTVAAVGDDGALTLLAAVPTEGGKCVATDEDSHTGHVWVCDPAHGQLQRFDDTLGGAPAP